jgi:site-specific DNA-methyltransferase (adenine-specific)
MTQEHRLFHGDCLDLMSEIADGSIDLVLVDLPYGTTRSKWDVVIPFEPMWEHVERVAKMNAALLFFCAQPFTTALISSRMDLFRYDLVWRKTGATGHLNAKRMPLRSHETVAVFYWARPTYNPQFRTGKRYKIKQGKKTSKIYGNHVKTGGSSASRYPTSVVDMPSIKRTQVAHPNAKPPGILEWLIRTYSNEGETVLDFTMGSGSTGVAAMRTKRNFVGIEREDKYFELAKKRIDAAQSQLVMFA